MGTRLMKSRVKFGVGDWDKANVHIEKHLNNMEDKTRGCSNIPYQAVICSVGQVID